MSATQDQFKSYLEQKRAEAIAAKEQAPPTPAETTAVHVDKLTRDPEWNLYLQKLQVHIDRMEAHRDDMMQKAMQAAPPDIHQGLLYEYWKTVGFLNAIELASKLPKTLVEQAKGTA